MLCTGDGKRLCDLQRENQAREQCSQPESGGKVKAKAALYTSISSNLAVRVFDDITRWLQVHSKDGWFDGQSSIEMGKLLDHIERDVFFHDSSDHARMGFLKAMLLAEQVLVHGRRGSYDRILISQTGMDGAILDCSRASYSSSSELEDLRLQLYNSAWVRIHPIANTDATLLGSRSKCWTDFLMDFHEPL